MFSDKYISRDILKKRLMEEPFNRRTFSFYRYVHIENPTELSEELFEKWSKLEAFGRIYIAKEGINAQMSIPENNWDIFVEELYANPYFSNVPFKMAVEDDGQSFYKLTIKMKKKIVADGLLDTDFDVTNVGKHLTPEEFNALMDDPNTVVIDMRNKYESEVGKFENAICPDVETFREALPKAVELAQSHKEKKILLYCTGGIRCEKASAYFKEKGFKDVNQLHGGIINYANEIKRKKIPSKFKGKNFVFDERLGERITDDILSKCYQCETASDLQDNCRNVKCHKLIIQCENCQKWYKGCCSDKCLETFNTTCKKT